MAYRTYNLRNSNWKEPLFWGTLSLIGVTDATLNLLHLTPTNIPPVIDLIFALLLLYYGMVQLRKCARIWLAEQDRKDKLNDDSRSISS